MPFGTSFIWYLNPVPSALSNEQLGPKEIQSEQECSLDTPFGARNNVVKWW